MLLEDQKVTSDPTEKEMIKFSHLKIDAHILLHTRLAQSLFKGSWRHGKMGLVQFANLMNRLSKAAQQDDPYAEWVLLKTYQTLCEMRAKMKAIEMKFKNSLEEVRGMTIMLSSNTDPLRCPLKFATPFGFMGASLLADFDYIFRQHLTLNHIGVATLEDITVKHMVSYLQNAFAIPRHWHQTGTTRQDIADNTDRYQDAKKWMGEIPEAVLNKHIEFCFMPKPKKS